MDTREQNIRTWSMLCHFAALIGLIIPIGTLLGMVVGPLLVWQIKKNDLPEIDRHGKAAVNFQLTVLIINIVVGSFIGILGLGLGLGYYWRSPFYMFGSGLGFGLILAILDLAALILAVVAGLKANNGEFYRYPFSIQFLK